MYGLPPQRLRTTLMASVSLLALMNAIPSLTTDPSK